MISLICRIFKKQQHKVHRYREQKVIPDAEGSKAWEKALNIFFKINWKEVVLYTGMILIKVGLKSPHRKREMVIMWQDGGVS